MDPPTSAEVASPDVSDDPSSRSSLRSSDVSSGASSLSGSDSEEAQSGGGVSPSVRKGSTGTSTSRDGTPSEESATEVPPLEDAGVVGGEIERVGTKRKSKSSLPPRKRLSRGAHNSYIKGDDGRKAFLKRAMRKTRPPQDMYMFENIIDRRSSSTGIEYYVMWKEVSDPVTKKLVRSFTWEPAARLREDGCGSLLKLVDDWVDNVKRRFPFESYLKSSALAIGVMGASTRNDCTFVAVRAAYQALGLHKVATRKRFEAYVATLSVDISGGLGWPKLYGFLLYLHREVPGCAIDWALIGNLYEGDGTKHDGIV